MVDHDNLVRSARDWLCYTMRCRLVAVEFSSCVSETPDVVGFKSCGTSIVVECKTSRADFFANEKKAHESNGLSIGDFRWFLTPESLVDKNETPAGWGLLEHRKSEHQKGYYRRIILNAPKREKNSIIESFEKRMVISIAGRALDALNLVKPFSIGEEPTSQWGPAR